MYTLLLVHSIHRGYIHVEVPRGLRRVPQTSGEVRTVFDAGVRRVVGGEGEEEGRGVGFWGGCGEEGRVMHVLVRVLCIIAGVFALGNVFVPSLLYSYQRLWQFS